MNKEQEKLEQHDPSGEVNPKWAAQFADAFAKAIGSRMPIPGVRVIEPAPVPIEEPCTEEEARKYDELVQAQRDFYKLGENGKPVGGIRYRFVHWMQQWGHTFSDSAPGMGNPFKAMAFIEAFRFVDRPTNARMRGGISNRQEQAREIISSGFHDAREFLKTHVPTVRELTPEEIEAL